MADAHKYQAHEVLNRVLNAGEDGLNVDLADSVTVTVDSEFPAASAISDDFANPTTTSAMSMLMGYDGSTWDRVTIGGGTEAAALRVTIANDSTGVVSIDDGGGALTVDGTVTANLGTTDNAVLDAIAASLALLDNSIASGSELQVDVVGALPAGSAAIGKLAANSGVDIGDVDVTSVVPGYAATSLGKREDDAHSSLDTGVMILAVRNDALESLSGTDGDYSALQVNKTGALNVTETVGHLGAIFEDGTDNITSKQVIAIQFIEDTTFTTLTPVDSSYIGTASGNGDAIDTDNTFPQGMTIFGRWTGYRLASGSIVAYQGSW